MSVQTCSPMDTQIFKQGLSILTTSVYIIIAALQGDGAKPHLSAIEARWNETPEGLQQSLTELLNLKIIARHPGLKDTDPIYLVNPASMWGVWED